MSDLVAIAFDTPDDADRACAELTRLQGEGVVDLEDATVAILSPGGRLHLRQRNGSGGDAISRELVDHGIDEPFIRALQDGLRPSMSALFVLIRQAEPEKLIAELSRFRGRVLRSSLSPDQEARLRTALSGGGGG